MPFKLIIISFIVSCNLFTNAQDSIPMFILSEHNAAVNSIDLSPDGNHLISGSKDETLKIWDLKTQKAEKTITTKGSSVKRVCFNSTGTKFLGALYSQFIEVDFKTFKGKFSKKNSHTAFVETCKYSNDDNYILTSSWRDNALSLWKSNSLKKQIDFQETNWIDNAIFNENASNVISGGHDNLVKIWDVATGKIIKSFAGHDDWVYDVCLSKDEKYIYSGSFDKTVKIWDVTSGKNIATLKDHTDGIVCLDLSKDGKYLASAGMDKNIVIWDIASKTIIQKIKAHSGAILDLKFNQDATILYSCSIDKTIKCWQLKH
jgi:WD40 repeat protein